MASKDALEVAKKQGKLGYRIKRSKSCYVMMAPYFILFFWIRSRLCRNCSADYTDFILNNFLYRIHNESVYFLFSVFAANIVRL